MAKASVSFVHANDGGDGTLLRVELHYQTDSEAGFYRLTFAKQKGDSFDFENCVSCDLRFQEASQLILVLNGEEEATSGGSPIETSPGVYFAAKHAEGSVAIAARRASFGGNEDFRIILSRSESNGLAKAIEGGMFFLSFIKGVNT